MLMITMLKIVFVVSDENLLGSNGTFAIDGHKFEIKISEVSEKGDEVRI